MTLIDLIPWVGTIANAVQALFADSQPAASAWTLSSATTVGSFAAARGILMLSFWDDVVRATATKWDDRLLKGVRQILAVLAVKPAKKS